MISSISQFEIISVVITNKKTLFSIAASVADATSVNPNSIRTLLANDVNILFINGKSNFINEETKLRILLSDKYFFLEISLINFISYIYFFIQTRNCIVFIFLSVLSGFKKRYINDKGPKIPPHCVIQIDDVTTKSFVQVNASTKSFAVLNK